MTMSDTDVRKLVRERYGEVAARRASCCGSGSTASRAVGYTDDELASIPDGSDLGLGCGNPTALASLKPGETVLDLGSGAGIDCFLAASAVGAEGRVIGVDMTAEMVERARDNAGRSGVENVEFRLGEIEHLPVADGEVDVVISNCVINLSPDKPQVFREAFRALRSGGRLLVSDIVRLRELPDDVRTSSDALVGCIAGASRKQDYLGAIEAAGFDQIVVRAETQFDVGRPADAEMRVESSDLGLPPEDAEPLGKTMASISVEARKL